MTEDYLQELETQVDLVLRGNLLGIGLDKTYNLVAIEVPLLINAVRRLKDANHQLRMRVSELEGASK